MVRRVILSSLSWFFCVALSLALSGVSASAETAQLTLLHAPSIPGFVVAPSISVSAAPNGVAVGDLNGDGRPDLVVTAKGPSATVFLADGSGGFASGLQFAAGTQPGNPLLADLNGDGKLDLVVTDAATGAIDVLFGNGDGTFGNPAAFAAIQNPVALAIGDFSGKGKIDLAVASSTGLVVLLNDGSGHFAGARSVAIKGQPLALAAADLRGSGHDDIILANQDGTVGILLGDGNGSFQPFMASSVASGALSGIVSLDFNGDGRADIAVTQANSNTVTVLLSRGDGTFQPGVAYTTGNGPAFVMATDLRGIGIADLITVNQAANTVSILEGIGDGTFHPAQDFVAGNSPIAAAAGDFNGDGHADLAIANYGDHTISVPLGRGDGTLIAARSYRAGLEAKSIASGDLNGDGRPDLVVANSCGSDAGCASSGSASIFLANFDGTYSLASTIELGSGPVAVALADLNGDKKLDLLALNRNDKTLLVMTGNGDGTFGKTQSYNLTANPRAIFVGDFNSDGNPDVAIAMDCGQQICAQRGTVDIWLGHSDGSLTEAGSYPVGYSPVSIAAADLRGTGHLDLIVANTCGSDSSCKSVGTATLLAGDGTGKFSPLNEIEIGSAPSSIAVGNLSGTGIDLVVALGGSNQVAVMHANGNGGFNAPATYAVGSAPSSLTITDVNGDGKPDVAVANQQSSTVSLLLGTGGGALQSAATYTVGTGPESLTAVSGANGKASLVTANGNSGSSAIGNSITSVVGGLKDPPSTTAFTSAANIATVNQQVTMTGMVTPQGAGTPTGNVIFAIDTGGGGTGPFTDLSDCGGATGLVIDTNGNVSCTTQLLPAGNPTNVQLQYLGDGTFSASNSADQGQTIAQGATMVTVTPASAGTVDQPVTLTATVAPTPTPTIPSDVVAFAGTIAFQSNGTNITGCGTQTVGATVAGAAAATCTTSALTAPSVSITAQYNAGDANYLASPVSAAATQSMNPANTSVTVNSISPTAPTVNQAFTVTATVSPNPLATVSVPFSGKMSFFLDGSATAISGCNSIAVNTTTGVATCPVPVGPSLTAGSHFITAGYNSGDTNYNQSPLSGQFSFAVSATGTSVAVNSVSPTSPAVNQAFTINATVSPNPTATVVVPFAGTMSFYFDGSPTAINGCGTISVNTTTGVASCSVPANTTLAAGGHSVTAQYNSGDTNYNASAMSALFPFTVAKANTTTAVALTSGSNPSTVNSSLMFTATITPPGNGIAVSGNVTFSDNGSTITNGSNCGTGNSGVVTVTWNPTNSTGTATCTTSALKGGPHSIVATYGGDTNYNTSNNNTAQTVNPASTTVAAPTLVSPTSPTVNQTVTVSATVSSAPTLTVPFSGTMAFFNNGAAISGCGSVSVNATSGLAQCQITGLAANTFGITAQYNAGDASYSQSAVSSGLSLVIGQTATTVSLSANPNPSTVDQSVTFTATITASQTGSIPLAGTVTFNDSVTGTAIPGCSGVVLTVSGGKTTAACNYANLSMATHTITATYGSDPNFSGNSGTVSQVVTAASSNITLTSSNAASTVNQVVTFTASIAVPSGSTAPKGQVAFTATPQGGAPLAIAGCSAVGLTSTSATNYTANCPDANLTAVGSPYTISASYSNDSNFAVGPGTTAQTVNKASTSLALGSSANPSLVNQSVTFTATVSPSPAGNVPLGGTVAFVDSVTSAVISGCSAVTPATSGIATCATSTLAVSPPSHTITATYSNDSNFTGNSAIFSQTVNPTTGVIALSPPIGTTSTVNTSVTFTATIPIPAGLPSPQGKVTFTDNGSPIASCPAAVPSSNWIATCTDQTLIAGPHTIVAAYSGDPNVSVNNGTTTITMLQGASSTVVVSNLNPSYAFLNNSNSSQYTVTFKATVSAPAGAVIPLSQGTVAFSGNGIPSSCAAVAVTGGVATCTSVTLPSGSDSIVAAYTGDPNYAGSSNSVIQLVQDYSISVANVPAGVQGVLVTQGYTTSNDIFPLSQPITLSPTSTAGFSSSNVKLACASGSSGAPKCTLTPSTMSISGTPGALQPSIGILLDATGSSVAPGTYTFTITATDSTSGIVRTTTFPVTVRGAAGGGNSLTVISGATTNNTGNVSFSLPPGVTLTNLLCASIAGTGITGTEAPSKIGVGCTIAPASLGSKTSTTVQNATAAVTVTTNNTFAAVTPLDTGNRHPAYLVAGVFGLPFIGLIGFLRRRALKSALFSLIAFAVLGIAALSATGCGGSYHSTSTPVTGGTTPPGVYYLMVNGTGSDGNTYSAVLQLNVQL